MDGNERRERRAEAGSGVNRPSAAWALAAVALVIGLLVGVGVGFALSDDDGTGGEVAATGEGTIPEACRAAIAEARSELDARQEALAIPEQLAALLERTGAAVTDLDTAELETILADLESLARDAEAAAAELRSDDFEEQARACEGVSPA
jgi:hypothetical protein